MEALPVQLKNLKIGQEKIKSKFKNTMMLLRRDQEAAEAVEEDIADIEAIAIINREMTREEMEKDITTRVTIEDREAAIEDEETELLVSFSDVYNDFPF